MPIGPTELIIILVIVLILFGAKRLPELGRSLGTGMREFKDSVSSKDRDDAPSELPPPASTESKPAPEADRVPADERTDRS